MPIIPRQPQPYDLVCACCGSDDLRIADSHGWMRCEDCGEEEYAVAREDFETPEEEAARLDQEAMDHYFETRAWWAREQGTYR